MNKQNELSEHIQNTWHQIKDAANNENWPATQQAFRKMTGLQDMQERSRILEEQIAGLSGDKSSNGLPALAQRTPSASVVHPDRTRRGTRRPQELRIGTYRVPIGMNNQIPIATANWILNQGGSLPRIPNFVHPSNSGFTASAQTKRLDDGSYIEIGDSQDALIQKARKLLNACGFRDVTLAVLLDDSTLRSG
jgi:hypothetical protein